MSDQIIIKKGKKWQISNYAKPKTITAKKRDEFLFQNIKEGEVFFSIILKDKDVKFYVLDIRITAFSKKRNSVYAYENDFQKGRVVVYDKNISTMIKTIEKKAKAEGKTIKSITTFKEYRDKSYNYNPPVTKIKLFGGSK